MHVFPLYLRQVPPVPARILHLWDLEVQLFDVPAPRGHGHRSIIRLGSDRDPPSRRIHLQTIGISSMQIHAQRIYCFRVHMGFSTLLDEIEVR
jgi:hypothetical protein